MQVESGVSRRPPPCQVRSNPCAELLLKDMSTNWSWVLKCTLDSSALEGALVIHDSRQRSSHLWILSYRFLVVNNLLITGKDNSRTCAAPAALPHPCPLLR